MSEGEDEGGGTRPTTNNQWSFSEKGRVSKYLVQTPTSVSTSNVRSEGSVSSAGLLRGPRSITISRNFLRYTPTFVSSRPDKHK